MIELGDRARRILHAVVLEFIETGEPIGSRVIAKKRVADLSPATIRNVMADLEEMGLLYQPHTSAGRVPTEQAFRIFIDALMTLNALSKGDEAEIGALDAIAPGEGLLHESGRVLSDLAGMVSIVLSSRTGSRVLSELHFVAARSTDRLLAVVVFADGTVETRAVPLRPMPSDAELERVHNLLGQVVAGKTLEEVRGLFAHELDSGRIQIDRVAHDAFELGLEATEPAEDQAPIVMIQGESRLLERPEFADAGRLRELVGALRERERLVGLLDQTIRSRAIQVLVGREAGDLAGGALSVVAAPFTDGGRAVGSIGVIGPVRMNYPRVVPLVSATATAVSAAHERGSRAGARRISRRPPPERKPAR
jgi:heat-inducible transcriptional repressor